MMVRLADTKVTRAEFSECGWTVALFAFAVHFLHSETWTPGDEALMKAVCMSPVGVDTD